MKHTVLILLILESLFHLKNTYQHDPFYPVGTLNRNDSIGFIILTQFTLTGVVRHHADIGQTEML